jgi:hypothetical protein
MTLEAMDEFAAIAENYIQIVANLLGKEIGHEQACVRVVSRLSVVLQSMSNRNPPAYIAETLKRSVCPSGIDEPRPMNIRDFASRGGKARAEKLSKQRLSEIGRKAVAAREAKRWIKQRATKSAMALGSNGDQGR